MANVQSVTDKMQSLIRQWEETGDRRAVFLDCYRRMTVNVLKAIEDGQFNDPVWVNVLLHRFAEYYFEALQAYDLKDPATPAIWVLAHNQALEAGTPIWKNLLLGVNAHINYDLVAALADVLKPEWAQLSAEQRDQRHNDHCYVNQIIRQTIDWVQDEVVERYSPLMDWVDKLLGPVDEWLTGRLIAGWRDQVWLEAVQLLETAGPDDCREQLARIERATLSRAEAILAI